MLKSTQCALVCPRFEAVLPLGEFKMRNGCLERRGEPPSSVSVHLNTRSTHASVHVHADNQ